MAGAATKKSRSPRFRLVLVIESCCEVDALRGKQTANTQRPSPYRETGLSVSVDNLTANTQRPSPYRETGLSVSVDNPRRTVERGHKHVLALAFC